NECCDVSSWAARKLICWSAHRHYAPPSRAEVRAEELAAYIDDCPGKLFKLITALAFAGAAIVTRKVAPGVAPPIPLWWPTIPAVPVRYSSTDTAPYGTVWGRPNAYALDLAWMYLTAEIYNAAQEAGVGNRSLRRSLKDLIRVTGDDRWTLVLQNINHLKQVNDARTRPVAPWYRSVVTDDTVTHYQAAVETARAEIRRLTCDFLRRFPGPGE
ncbi:MAG: hypothetical protein WB735_22150, partial [Pseudonocardiaceae bacterium]